MSSHSETDHLDVETLPRYPITLVPCEDGGFVAKITDLQGCIAQGDSAEEAQIGRAHV